MSDYFNHFDAESAIHTMAKDDFYKKYGTAFFLGRWNYCHGGGFTKDQHSSLNPNGHNMIYWNKQECNTEKYSKAEHKSVVRSEMEMLLWNLSDNPEKYAEIEFPSIAELNPVLGV